MQSRVQQFAQAVAVIPVISNEANKLTKIPTRTTTVVN